MSAEVSRRARRAREARRLQLTRRRDVAVRVAAFLLGAAIGLAAMTLWAALAAPDPAPVWPDLPPRVVPAAPATEAQP